MNTSLPKRLVLALALLAGTHLASAQWQVGDRLPAPGAFGLAGRLPDLAGRVVLVDFWASWCAPCKASFPVLDDLQKKFGPRGFTVLAVNVDDDAEDMARFLESHPVSFPAAHDAGQKYVAAAGVEAMPSSFLVDRSGTIRFVHVGFHAESTPAELAGEIESLLGTEAAP